MMAIADLKYACRLLAKKPGFTALTMLVMATGIGLSVYLFSFMHTVAFKDLPFEDSDSLIQLSWSQNGVKQSYGMDFLDYHEISQQIEGLSEVGAYRPVSVNVSGKDGARRYSGVAATPGFFQLTRTDPLMGRGFNPADARQGGERVVVIGHAMWQNRFGADPGVIDRVLRINGESHRIIGVMPEGYLFPQSAKLWLPMRYEAAALKRGEVDNVRGVGHLKDGVSIDDIDRQLAVIMQRLERQFPETNKGDGAYAHSIPLGMVGSGMPVVYSLHISAVLILILASINVGNLLLSRAIERGKETSIRMALGAPRARLIGQMLWESVIICGVGGVIGLLVLAWGLEVTSRVVVNFAVEDPPFWWDFGLDSYTLLLFASVMIGTIAVTGFLPAWRNSGGDFNSALRDGTRGAPGRRAGRLNRLLVISEIFLSITILIPAGTMIVANYKGTQADYGADTANVLTAKINLSESRYASSDAKIEFIDKLQSRLENSQGIGDVMLASALPGDWSFRPTVAVDGREYDEGGDGGYPRANYIVVMPGSLAKLGVRLKEGRRFDRGDNEAGKKTVVVTDSFVQRHFPDEHPLGKRVRIVEMDGERPRWLTIVGVVEHTIQGGPTRPVARAPSIFRPFAQAPRDGFTVAMEMDSDRTAVTRTLREVLESIDPQLPAFRIETYEEMTDRHTDPLVFISTVFLLFGIAAFVLAASGIYGVVLNTIAQGNREIGLKRALGAGDERVMKEFLFAGLKQLLWGGIPGLLAGGAMGFAISRIRGMDDDGLHVLVSIVVVVVTAAVVMLSTWVPTRRALEVEPGVALRHE